MHATNDYMYAKFISQVAKLATVYNSRRINVTLKM